MIGQYIGKIVLYHIAAYSISCNRLTILHIAFYISKDKSMNYIFDKMIHVIYLDPFLCYLANKIII